MRFVGCIDDRQRAVDDELRGRYAIEQRKRVDPLSYSHLPRSSPWLSNPALIEPSLRCDISAAPVGEAHEIELSKVILKCHQPIGVMPEERGSDGPPVLVVEAAPASPTPADLEAQDVEVAAPPSTKGRPRKRGRI